MNQKLRHIKMILIIFILFILLLYKGLVFNIFSNIRNITQKQTNPNISEINLLKENINYLEGELKSLGDTFSDNIYNYDLSKVSYIDPYNPDEFYIYNGENKNYQKNDILKNEFGVVGLIEKVYKDYSKCKLLTSITNLSVIINDNYGTLYDYDGTHFLIKNISNYDQISLNDEVYTSPKGIGNEKIYIGYVSKIENKDIEKIIYIKSEVNFNNINYLHVIGDL